MIAYWILYSAREVSCFVDQGFFYGLYPMEDNYRLGTNEKAVDITIAFCQLGRENKVDYNYCGTNDWTLSGAIITTEMAEIQVLVVVV